MGNWVQKIRVCRSLGIKNVLTVASYRALLRSGLLKSCLPAGTACASRLFHPTSSAAIPLFACNQEEIVARADSLLQGRYRYFCHHELAVGSPPDWFKNPFNGASIADAGRHWSEIADFSSGVGDIKTIWELSRFQWAVDLALAFRVTGDNRYLETLNSWACAWTLQNPVNAGPNWKCGQEAGLRMIQVLLAAYLAGQHNSPTDDLPRFVREHCRRIEPTIGYALAQNNNHGTSEAAALFIGGTWLLHVGADEKLRGEATRWQRKGRRWLEDRARKLVQDDGSFSQYSVAYHRLLVETLSLVEFWRRELRASRFSDHFYRKAGAAVAWLAAMTDPLSGDAPNIGANDGTQLLRLATTGYRDFRPCVQLGAALFQERRLYPAGPWDEALYWLGIDTEPFSVPLAAAPVQQFKDGGYVVFLPQSREAGHSWGVVRYPNFRFRPGHADGLHFDLWWRGVNLLRDAGSYSYNTVEPWQSYFSATAAHNTVQIDERDQMPRLSRFLYESWLKMLAVEVCQGQNGTLFWSGIYGDYAGGKHMRSIECSGDTWRITDRVTGLKQRAVLRWRLVPDEWRLEERRCFGKMAEIEVEASVPVLRSAIVDGWESRYYLQKSRVPVWEVVIAEDPATLITTVRLKKGTVP